MSSTLKPQLERLHTELVWLHTRWINYRQLLAEGPEQVGLLNCVAPSFFGVIERVMRDDIVIGLSRLTDRKRVAAKDTLTLSRLIHELHPADDRTLAIQLRGRLKEINAKIKDIRTHRNQRVAHLDLVAAIPAVSVVSLGFSRQTISEVLTMIGDFLNCLQVYFGNTPTGFDKTYTQYGDASVLVSQLRRLPPRRTK